MMRSRESKEREKEIAAKRCLKWRPLPRLLPEQRTVPIDVHRQLDAEGTRRGDAVGGQGAAGRRHPHRGATA